ncbi:MAG TPA: aminodeoxychorismate lyase [Gammaproteobacteria bacterium]|nr:aminodeoxychorismate lyase [Gammaproteobacteria bacterium]
MPATAVLLNGQPRTAESATVSVFDRGFQYGDGVFETLAAVDGQARDRDAHMARLAEGARLLGIPAPDPAVLAAEIDALAGAADDSRAVIKVAYSRGRGGRGLAPPEEASPTRVVMRLPWPDHPRDWADSGVRTIACRTRQVSGAALDGRIKSMNQLNHIVARMEWRDPRIAEGLLCDDRGCLVEGTVTNLFAVRDGEVVTPDLSGSGLPGITRGRILALAGEHGVGAREADLRPGDLAGADELFLTNSLVGVWPVREHDGRALPGAPGPVTRRLQRALEASYAESPA